MRKKLNKGGFTLLEILLVVAAIAILAGIVIIAINPAKQLGDTRNAQRRIDINTILNAIHQYYIDEGSLPSTIPASSAVEICETNAVSCSGLISLVVLTEEAKYLTAIPSDPGGDCSSNGVCYEIYKGDNGRITVSAPDAEEDKVISVTR